jgi:hypothetical protein
VGGQHGIRSGSGLTLIAAPLYVAAHTSSPLIVSATAGWLIGGITAPFWAGFVVAVLVSAATWHVFNRATVAQAYEVPYT